MKVTLKPGESALSANRRLRKLLERDGTLRELRQREHYIKPSEVERQRKANVKRRQRANS